MKIRTSKGDYIGAVCEALDIAEDKTGNYYKFSFGQWKRHHFDVRTMGEVKPGVASRVAFALLNKGSRVLGGYDSKTKIRDFYFICLQDHQILKAVNRDRNLSLLPLLVYVFTHELVHIVRFCNFFQRFDITGKEREEEESRVHEITFDILRDMASPKMDYILESYKNFRICDIVAN